MFDFLPSFDVLVRTVSVYAIPVVLAITLHEVAHGYVARQFGDTTAMALGRLSLNPAKHIDPWGTIGMPLLLYFLTAGNMLFGYAKPVPVNPQYLRRPHRDMFYVALAGPLSNFVMAFLWLFGGTVLLHFLGVREAFFIEMINAGISINLVLCALNLLPLPPLDGGRVLVALLPQRYAASLERVEPWGFFILIALALAGVLRYWMEPLMSIGLALMRAVLSVFF